VFILKSNKSNHFKLRIALMNSANEIVLEWLCQVPVYHGSVPDSALLNPAKHDGVFTFEISLLPLPADLRQHNLPRTAVNVPHPRQVLPPPVLQPKVQQAPPNIVSLRGTGSNVPHVPEPNPTLSLWSTPRLNVIPPVLARAPLPNWHYQPNKRHAPNQQRPTNVSIID